MPFDADDERARIEAAAAEKQKIPPLNPPFPFRPEPFDPFVFGVPTDPFPKGQEPRE